MKYLGFIFLVFFNFPENNNAYAQDHLGINLVPNPSFEDKDNCPQHWTYSGDLLFGVRNWHTVANHLATPDYFNRCSPAPGPLIQSVSVPVNDEGGQDPHSGDAYCGIISRSLTASHINYSEYISVELSVPLVQGLQYSASMFVSASDASNLCNAGLGICISDYPINGGGTETILTHLIPQVLNRYAITDQQNWTQISGKFVAGGGEKYLIIGVFNEFLSSPQAKPGHSFSGSAYYYIDDVSVSVEDICTHPCPPQASYMPITTVPDLTVPNLILHCTPNHTPISITFYGGLSYEFVILSNTQQVMYSFSEFFPLGSEGEFFVNWNGEENNGTALPQGVYNAILKIFNCQGSQQFNFAVNTTGSGVNPIHLPPLINIPYPGFSSCCR